MAESNAPQPKHPLVTSLDPAFTGHGGNAAGLAGWLEYLAHPDMNTGPRVLEFQDGSAIESSHKPHPNTTGHVKERSVLRDLTLNRFFAHADVLSGQQVGTLTEDGDLPGTSVLGATFQLIEEVRFQKPHRDTGPRPNSADVWKNVSQRLSWVVDEDNWDDEAGTLARDKYIQLSQWYDNHRTDAMFQMKVFLAKYAAIILKARADINELMGTLIKVLEDWTATNSLDGIKFLLSALREVVGIVLEPPKTVAKVALTIYDQVQKLAPGAKKSDDSGFGVDSSDIHLAYYRMLESYIAAGDKVCWEAAGAVARLITDAEHGLLFVRNNWVAVPEWSQ